MMKKLITMAMLTIGLSLGMNVANAACVSVGDVKEVINNGRYTTLITDRGTFTVSKPLAVAQTFLTDFRHAPACYNSSRNSLTYTTPDGKKATVKIE